MWGRVLVFSQAALSRVLAGGGGPIINSGSHVFATGVFAPGVFV